MFSKIWYTKENAILSFFTLFLFYRLIVARHIALGLVLPRDLLQLNDEEK